MVHVENCVIANMVGIGINQLKGTLELKDTIIRNNGNIGVYVVGPAQANLDHVRLEANDTGLAAEFGGQAAMQDSVVTGSNNIGVLATNPTVVASQVTMFRSLISSNNFGVYIDANNGYYVATVAISDSTISQNSVGIHLTGNGRYESPGHVHLKHNTVTTNGTGLEVVSSGWAFIDDNDLTENQFDLSEDNESQISTRNNNNIGGGHWNFPSITPISTL